MLKTLKKLFGKDDIDDIDLAEKIVKVAIEFENPELFTNSAKKVASELNFLEAQKLTSYFHNPPQEPEFIKSTTANYGVLGVWMGICQDAIFEILYHYKEDAIIILYMIGFGQYDWTQYKAIDVLCRLANDGIETERIVKNIGENLHHFRYEAVMPSMESLSEIENSENVPKILKKLFDEYVEDDVIDGFYILNAMAKNYPNEAKKELDFLKSLANGIGLENRSPFLDGAVMTTDENGKNTFFINGEKIEGNFNLEHQLNSALLYQYLEPNDAEINKLVSKLSDAKP
jgi:hypothetical protein